MSYYQDADPAVLDIFKPGTLIDGKYEVITSVERGKYGQVFKCKDLYNKGKFVAAKVSNSATIDIDNAKVESKLMEKLL